MDPTFLGSLLTEAEFAGRRTITTTSSDPVTILAGTRVAYVIPVPGIDPLDLTVVSPPPNMHNRVLFVGHDVLQPGLVTVYLYNAGAESVTVNSLWTIRSVRF